jgi:hypothetical protein
MRIHRPDTGSLGTQQAIKLRAEDRLISPARYADLEQRLRQQLNKSSINLEDMKQLLATRPEFMQSLWQHAIGAEAFGKQFSDCQTLTDPSRRPVRKVMTQPTQRYKGCLASRLQPADNGHCLNNYDDEQCQNIGLVPTALKQRVYDKRDSATRGILKETLTRKTRTISDTPSGYRQFIVDTATCRRTSEEGRTI